MNFSQVENLTIPEGSVKAIKEGNDFLWVANPPQVVTSTIFPFTYDGSYGGNLAGYNIYGKTEELTAPSINTPATYRHVGDLVDSEYSEFYGKYKIDLEIGTPNIFNKNSSIIPSTALLVMVMPYLSVGRLIAWDGEGQGAISTGQEFVPAISENARALVIKVNPNSSYSFDFFNGIQGTAKQLYAEFKYAGGKFTCTKPVTSFSGTSVQITPNADSQFIVLQYSLADDDYVMTENGIVVSEGITLEKYSPYKVSSKNSIYLSSPLRGIGDYRDYTDPRNKRIVRNIKELKFTGHEEWVQQSSLGKIYFCISKSDLGTNSEILPEGSTSFFCNYFNISTGKPTTGFVQVGKNYLYFNYDGENQDIDEFEYWLSNKNSIGIPVTLTYPLATPEFENVTFSKIVNNLGGNTVNVTSSLKTEKVSVEYYGKEVLNV